MRKSFAGQSEYVWTCFIISSFILTSIVDCQPSLIKSPASDVNSRQGQATRAILDQGQTIKATLDQRQTTIATLEQGQTIRATLDKGQTTRATLDQGQTTRATLDQGQTTRATLDQGQTTRATLDQGQTTRATLDQGQTARATLDQEHTTRATLDQERTTRATLDQGQTRNIIQKKKTTVEWQHSPLVTSENDGEGNTPVNRTANTNSLYGNKDKLTTDDSAHKANKYAISNGGKNNNTEDDNINELDSGSGEIYGNNNSNSNNKPSSISNNDNHNTDHNEMYNNCSSENCIHPFHSHELNESSNNNNNKSDSNSDTNICNDNNDNDNLYFYDDYYHNNITTDIDNVFTIHGQTNNQTFRPTTTTSITFDVSSELQNIYYSLLWYSTLVIQPVLGLLGLTGNVLSGILATKSGLNKATNIFILALAVADSCTLIHSINVANILRFFPKYFSWYYLAWEYPPSLAYFCFVLTILTGFVLRLSGIFISGYICTLITVERFLAVYYPLRFKTIMTPRRAWVCVVCIFLFWISYAVISPAMLDRLQIYYSPSLNIYASFHFRKKASDVMTNMDGYFFTPMGKIFPVIVTVAGSILIGVKVRGAEHKRKTMTIGSKKSGSRTTKTLMLVCGVFLVAQSVSLPIFVYHYVLKDDIYMSMFLCVYYIVQSINGSCNFIIYVVFNKKFRAELKGMFSCCSKVLHKQNGTRSTSCTTTSQLQ